MLILPGEDAKFNADYKLKNKPNYRSPVPTEVDSELKFQCPALIFGNALLAVRCYFPISFLRVAA